MTFLALAILTIAMSLPACSTLAATHQAPAQLTIKVERALDDARAKVERNPWEIVAAVSAALGVLVSATGLWFIRRQLIQTGRSLDAAGKSADAAATAARIAFQQSRPWMKLSLNGRNAEIHFLENLDIPQITIPVRYENVGQTPALNHIVLSRGIRDAHRDNGQSIRDEWQKILATDWFGQTAIFPGETVEAGCGTVLPWPAELQTASFSVLIACLYKSTVDEPWHATPMVVHLHGPQPTGQPIRMAPGLRFPVILTSGHDQGLHPI